jgi:hypothetical protein
MDLSYTKIMHFENILFRVKCKQKFEIYLYFHISKWLQKVLFLTNFEACLNVIKALFVWDYKLDYSQIIIQIIYTYQIYAKSRSALGCIHIPLNQTQHNIHFVDGRSLHTKVSKLSCVCVLIAMLYRSGSATMHSHC